MNSTAKLEKYCEYNVRNMRKLLYIRDFPPHEHSVRKAHLPLHQLTKQYYH